MTIQKPHWQGTKRNLVIGLGLSLLLLSTSVLVVPPVRADETGQQNTFNNPGNVLITDQFNNRVIEVDPVTKNIVWSFGSGDPTLCNPGPGAIIGTNDAERLSDGLTLISGTGIPPGASSSMPNGCVDNRVIVVNQAGQIVWQYGQAGVTGHGPNMLNVPVFAIQLPNHDFLITDQEIIELSKSTRQEIKFGRMVHTQDLAH
jgi:hypothetical protein